MMTLIDSNETGATYEFAHDTATRLVTFSRPQNNAPVEGEEPPAEETAAEAPTFDDMATAEHALWLAWLGVEEQ